MFKTPRPLFTKYETDTPLHARHRTFYRTSITRNTKRKDKISQTSSAMSFRKRNIGLGRTENTEVAGSSTAASREHSTPTAQDTPSTHPTLPGTRPSPVDGRLTTSTGTPTLDTLLAGHVGLALGHSIILEENGTTDYTGSLLKYYAAEGIVQGHTVHIVESEKDGFEDCRVWSGLLTMESRV